MFHYFFKPGLHTKQRGSEYRNTDRLWNFMQSVSTCCSVENHSQTQITWNLPHNPIPRAFQSIHENSRLHLMGPPASRGHFKQFIHPLFKNHKLTLFFWPSLCNWAINSTLLNRNGEKLHYAKCLLALKCVALMIIKPLLHYTTGTSRSRNQIIK